jgi:hypothetical protein
MSTKRSLTSSVCLHFVYVSMDTGLTCALPVESITSKRDSVSCRCTCKLLVGRSDWQQKLSAFLQNGFYPLIKSRVGVDLVDNFVDTPRTSLMSR